MRERAAPLARLSGQPCRALALALCLAVPAGAPAAAQDTPAAAPASAPVNPAAEQTRGELDRVTGEIRLSDEVVARLKAEIASIDKDRAALAARLVDTGNRTRDLEGRLFESEAHLASLKGQEDGITASLAARRGVLVEVIAALQRMGHNAPPALIARPEDALKAVRSAMLLGAVVPELRHQTDALVADLNRLGAVRAEIVTARDAVRAELQDLQVERTRIDLLVEERQKVLEQQRRTLETEEAHVADLAKRTTTLKGLIAEMEKQGAPGGAAATAAAESDATLATKPPQAQMAALENPARLAPAVPFEKTRGLLNLPAAGRILTRFGQDDGSGNDEKGMTLATGASAIVVAPSDGWVVYAGNFRSYGRLLIINAGGGYHIVMAGMRQVDVRIGQFVLKGEPVGEMGVRETQVASASATVPTQPRLYIEFRKDGVSIDPTPWWSKSGEKARG